MSDIEIVGYAEWLAAQLGIDSRIELKKEDPGLVGALWDRNLMDEVGISRKFRDWSTMGTKELVEHAKAFIAERGIPGRKELARADKGLYEVLRKRKLLDEVGLPSSREDSRDWAGTSNDELIAHAKEFIAERGITGRGELAKADSGLYSILGKRKLLDEVGLPDLRGKIRNWAGMERDKLIAHAKAFIEERGIGGREELAKTDKGQYQALRKRKLLDAVFSEIESSGHKDAVTGVLSALESFGDGK